MTWQERRWGYNGKNGLGTPKSKKGKSGGTSGGGGGKGRGRGGRGGGGGGSGPADPLFSSVSFLSAWDGADLATTATDDSSNAHVISFSSGANLTTTNPKFGTACLTGDGTGNGVVTIPNHASLNFAGEDHTIELWSKKDVGTPVGSVDLIAKYNPTGNQRQWILEYDWISDKLKYFVSTTGTNVLTVAEFTMVTDGVDLFDTNWHHVAVTREGDVYRMFIDGLLGGTSTSQAGSLFANTTTTCAFLGSHIPFQNYDAELDEIRITKGEAIYTAPFTPPTTAFPRS